METGLIRKQGLSFCTSDRVLWNIWRGPSFGLLSSS